MKRLFALVALLSLLCIAAAQLPDTVATVDDFRACSITVRVGQGSGSGVPIVRKGVNYFWTCHHVTVGQSDVTLWKQIRRGDKIIGGVEFKAEVVHSSEVYDLALCRVLQTEFLGHSTVFYDGPVPDAGQPIHHVGSFLGPGGDGSYSTGTISLLNRSLNGWRLPVDQIILTAAPGSSGGGVFLPDGRCVGLVTGGFGQSSITVMIPVRHMRAFAKEVGCEWAL